MLSVKAALPPLPFILPLVVAYRAVLHGLLFSSCTRSVVSWEVKKEEAKPSPGQESSIMQKERKQES